MKEKDTLEKRIARVKSYEATKQTWRKKYDSKEFKEANSLNQELFGERLERKPGCECVEIFFFNLNHQYKTKEKIKIMSNKKFILKPGKVVMNYHFPEPLTNSNSDEDFIKLLSVNPKVISLFEKYPDNWEKLAKDFVPAKKQEDNANDEIAKLKTVPEFNAFAEKHGIDISSATNKEQRVALLTEGLKLKTPSAPVEKTDEEKANERFDKRSISLFEKGFTREPGESMPFVKGDLSISFEDAYSSTDEEFELLLPTE